MRVTEMAKMFMNDYSSRNQIRQPVLPNGVVPAKDYVNPFEDPYMDITGKSPSEWQKIIPVDEEVAKQLKNLIKEDFVERNGMCGDGNQADAQANIIKSYIAKLPGEQRLAAVWSCEQIAFQEADRLSSKIREHNPGWQYGEDFERSILDDGANGIDTYA